MKDAKPLTYEEVVEILNEDYDSAKETSRSIWEGLQILSKYCTSDDVIGAAAHDQFWSHDIEECIEGGLTREEVISLRNNGWFEDSEAFSHFA